ncbi:MAG: aldehyde dehydrogenase family protein [Emcibacter sp.]|nr:aldehyde dehydrogenase family protein [Emcibacter sp.]
MLTTPFIDGKWVAQSDVEQLDCIDPATEKVIVTIQTATVQDVEDAVSAANRAFEEWSATSGQSRGVILSAIADIMERDAKDLSELSTLINGKPLGESYFDIEDAIATYRYYAQQAAFLDDKQETDVPLAMEGFSSYVRFEPIGVVALITPWNFPLVTSAWKIAPALAAGCTVILKPAEAVSTIELELGRIVQEAKLPKGVLNILPGPGARIGPQLVNHANIDKVSFTGGNKVGETVMKDAASTTKDISLELGGKSPILVFDDANMDKAVDAIMAGIFYNSGQMCSATSRLLMHENIADELVEKLLTEIGNLKIGPGLAAGSQMGPMTTKRQYEAVLKTFETAQKENLTLITGGKALDRKGYFLEPTVYVDVPVDSSLWTDEIFGPVLCTKTFKSEAEAIALANDCKFGLAATICSSDTQRLRRVSKKLKAGHIWWNMPQIVPVETSWGGFKASGIGRELGPWGLSSFQAVKHIDFETGERGGPRR